MAYLHVCNLKFKVTITVIFGRLSLGQRVLTWDPCYVNTTCNIRCVCLYICDFFPPPPGNESISKLKKTWSIKYQKMNNISISTLTNCKDFLFSHVRFLRKSGPAHSFLPDSCGLVTYPSVTCNLLIQLALCDYVTWYTVVQVHFT